MEKIEEPKERVEFIFQHPKDKTVLTSHAYSIQELIDKNDEDIFWDTCHCDCKPIGESSYTDCNCEDYYMEFELIGKRVVNGYTTRNDEVVAEIEDSLKIVSDFELAAKNSTAKKNYKYGKKLLIDLLTKLKEDKK